MKRFLYPKLLQSSRSQTRTLRPLTATLSRASSKRTTIQRRSFSNTKMSFSNTNTGDKPADPYKEKNIDDASIKDKVEDLSEFVSSCKFGMMTTRDGSSGALVSRCMALAAKVGSRSPSFPFLQFRALTFDIGERWHRPHLPHQHRIWQNLRH